MRNTLKTLAVCLVVTLSLSCAKVDQASRIKVLTSDGTSLTSILVVPVEGGSFTLNANAVSDNFVLTTPSNSSYIGYLTGLSVGVPARLIDLFMV